MVTTAKIITFYAYQRGLGRTLTVANISWILASNGYRVLAVDWDLEAPGLHRYFQPFLSDPELKTSDGLIDFVRDLALKAASAAGQHTDQWYEEQADLSPYILSLDMEFRGNGGIDMLPPGRQSATYLSRVAAFNWNDFYERFDGGLFLETVKKRMRAQYDYVLIDGGPGNDPAAAVSAVQMPDDLVVGFSPTKENLEGTAAIVRSIVAQRTSQLRIFPAPMRVPQMATANLASSRRQWTKAFNGMLQHLPDPKRSRYWRDVAFQEFPEYISQRTLSTLIEDPGTKGSMLAACEHLIDYLSDGAVTHLKLLASASSRGNGGRKAAALRDKSKALYAHPPMLIAPQASPAASMAANVFISYSHRDVRFKRELESMLRPLVRNGPIVPWDDTMIQPGDLWKEEIKKALNAANVAVLLVSRHFLDSQFIVTNELPQLLQAAKNRGLGILWVLVGACLYDEEKSLVEFQAAHDVAKPLGSLTVSKRNEQWVQVCKRIKTAVIARQQQPVH